MLLKICWGKLLWVSIREYFWSDILLTISWKRFTETYRSTKSFIKYKAEASGKIKIDMLNWSVANEAVEWMSEWQMSILDTGYRRRPQNSMHHLNCKDLIDLTFAFACSRTHEILIDKLDFHWFSFMLILCKIMNIKTNAVKQNISFSRWIRLSCGL